MSYNLGLVFFVRVDAEKADSATPKAGLDTFIKSLLEE